MAKEWPSIAQSAYAAIFFSAKLTVIFSPAAAGSSFNLLSGPLELPPQTRILDISDHSGEITALIQHEADSLTGGSRYSLMNVTRFNGLSKRVNISVQSDVFLNAFVSLGDHGALVGGSVVRSRSFFELIKEPSLDSWLGFVGLSGRIRESVYLSRQSGPQSIRGISKDAKGRLLAVEEDSSNSSIVLYQVDNQGVQLWSWRILSATKANFSQGQREADSFTVTSIIPSSLQSTESTIQIRVSEFKITSGKILGEFIFNYLPSSDIPLADLQAYTTVSSSILKNGVTALHVSTQKNASRQLQEEIILLDGGGSVKARRTVQCDAPGAEARSYSALVPISDSQVFVATICGDEIQARLMESNGDMRLGPRAALPACVAASWLERIQAVNVGRDVFVAITRGGQNAACSFLFKFSAL
jgi:hypothetical protein